MLMSNEDKVAAFLPWFADDPEAVVPLKLVIMLSSRKNLLRLVSKLFKCHAEEGTTKITLKGPREGECTAPRDPDDAIIANSLMPLLIYPVRDREGRLVCRERFPNLKSIDRNYRWRNEEDSLLDLNGLPHRVEELNVRCSRFLRSLAPLASAGTNLRKLEARESSVSSLKPLSECLNLQWLSISGTLVTDLSPLSACINLQVLWMVRTDLSDLSPLSGLHQLRSIGLELTEVADLSPLISLCLLENLECSSTKVSDLTPLSKCTKLKSLSITGTKARDLSPLASLPLLEVLHCYSTIVSDLSPLSKCSALKALSISDTKVGCLTPLVHCKKLKYLDHYGYLKGRDWDETRVCIQTLQRMMPHLEHVQLSYDSDDIWKTVSNNYIWEN